MAATHGLATLLRTRRVAISRLSGSSVWKRTLVSEQNVCMILSRPFLSTIAYESIVRLRLAVRYLHSDRHNASFHTLFPTVAVVWMVSRSKATSG